MKKLRDLQAELLYKEIKYNQEQLFVDYLNLNPHLYDELNIDNKTINLINLEFYLYYVYTENFYLIFRQELRKAYPIYLQILRTEMRQELFNLSTNIKYRNLADKRLDYNLSINKQNIETKTNGKTDSNGSSVGTNNNDVRTANKQLPLTSQGGDFDELFEWDTATFINEEDTSGRNTNTNSNTTTNEQTQNQENINKLKNYIKNYNFENVNEKELNQQAVKSINSIINYLWEDNKAKDFLFKKLKKCFVLVE